MFLINPYIHGYSPDRGYALRKLSPAHTYAIRVRRDSDNAELDIGFIGADLDESSLTTFLGLDEGFVTKFYDPFGSDDLVNATTTTQPKIATGGVIYKTNGKPSIYFASSLNSELNATIKGNTVVDISCVLDPSGTNERIVNFNSADSGLRNTVTDQLRIRGTSDVTIRTGTSGAGQLIIGCYGQNPCNTYYNNNTGGSGNRGSYAAQPLKLGTNSNSDSDYDGYFQELLLFTTDNSEYREAIRDEQNNYYGAF